MVHERHAVIVAGGGGVSRVHPALARRMKSMGRWSRPRGRNFRLRVDGQDRADSMGRIQRATADVQSASGPSTKHRVLWKLVLYGSGPLNPMNGRRHSDGRVLRGALLSLLQEHLGSDIAHTLSNHGTLRKSPIAVSVSSANPRRGFVTLLATDDDGSLQLLRELEVLLRDNPLVMGNGGTGTHAVRVEARLVPWVARGVYLGVAAPTQEDAMRLVPGCSRCTSMPGRAGKRAEYRPFRLGSRRVGRLPVQVGPMGSYGYGVLA